MRAPASEAPSHGNRDDRWGHHVAHTPDTTPEQGRQGVQEITDGLLSAVWELAYAGEVPAEQALELHHAARLMLAASEQLVRAAVAATADAALRHEQVSPR